MNYGAIYERLIAKATDRSFDGYTELHHIIPRCMGGTQAADNLVRLTPEEHFLAHQLLVKIHPEHSSLIYALTMMCTNKHGHRSNNKIYGWMRRRQADVASAQFIGKPLSAQTREKMSAVRKGREQTPEWIAKRVASFMKQTRTQEWCANISAGLTGKKGATRTPEWIEKVASTHRGKKRSIETRAKMSAARRKRVIKDETRAKISKSLKGRSLSEETREKIGVKARGRKSTMTPEARTANAFKAARTKQRNAKTTAVP